LSKKWLFYILFFLLLITGFYFTLTRVIPGFGDVRLPVLSYVQPFRFINQDGQAVTEQDLQGKVYVTEYFFTTCPNICPMMNSNMAKVYKRFREEKEFIIVSHTCDPDNDSAVRLHRYADSLGIDTGKWWFLTGRKDSLYNTARTSYLLDDPKNNLQKIEDQFMHTQFFALVDRSGRVRKIYDGLKQSEVDQLIADIPLLMREPVSSKRFANDLFSK
jgi:protein SCO1/2